MDGVDLPQFLASLLLQVSLSKTSGSGGRQILGAPLAHAKTHQQGREDQGPS